MTRPWFLAMIRVGEAGPDMGACIGGVVRARTMNHSRAALVREHAERGLWRPGDVEVVANHPNGEDAVELLDDFSERFAGLDPLGRGRNRTGASQQLRRVGGHFESGVEVTQFRVIGDGRDDHVLPVIVELLGAVQLRRVSELHRLSIARADRNDGATQRRRIVLAAVSSPAPQLVDHLRDGSHFRCSLDGPGEMGTGVRHIVAKLRMQQLLLSVPWTAEQPQPSRPSGQVAEHPTAEIRSGWPSARSRKQDLLAFRKAITRS
jgi:hypothetical protein